MRLPVRWSGPRCVFVISAILSLLGLLMISLPQGQTPMTKPLTWHVNTAHKKLVHEHVRKILGAQCHHGNTRRNLSTRLTNPDLVTQPFLWKDVPTPDHLSLYPPPFGLKGIESKVKDLLMLLESSHSAQLSHPTDECKRCVVVGNGGILRGLELGSLIDQFDTIIRLNSGPLGKFSVDVGNRTSIRMSYPEGTPFHWMDTDPHTLFVAVVYKSVDISWISAMINKRAVSLWNSLFFWQKVPDQIPLEPQRFRLLNPYVIKETAVDLLRYPPPRPRLLSWDQNVPTLGVSALRLASLLCDEVSLAGFGYNLSQQAAPLHYYDHLSMSAMQSQGMHNVDRETELLRSLVKEGTITDLTGGIHCSFCRS